MLRPGLLLPMAPRSVKQAIRGQDLVSLFVRPSIRLEEKRAASGPPASARWHDRRRVLMNQLGRLDTPADIAKDRSQQAPIGFVVELIAVVLLNVSDAHAEPARKRLELGEHPLPRKGRHRGYPLYNRRLCLHRIQPLSNRPRARPAAVL